MEVAYPPGICEEGDLGVSFATDPDGLALQVLGTGAASSGSSFGYGA